VQNDFCNTIGQEETSTPFMDSLEDGKDYSRAT